MSKDLESLPDGERLLAAERHLPHFARGLPAIASLCLALIPSCGPAELTPHDLCAEAATLVGEEVIVSGRPTPGAVTPLGHTLVLCAPGTCCNHAYYAPAFVCADGTTIYVAPSSFHYEADSVRLSYVCTNTTEFGSPSAACPLSAACASEFGQPLWLRGVLARREVSLDGPGEDLVLDVTSSNPVPLDAGRSSD